MPARLEMVLLVCWKGETGLRPRECDLECNIICERSRLDIRPQQPQQTEPEAAMRGLACWECEVRRACYLQSTLYSLHYYYGPLVRVDEGSKWKLRY